MKFRKSDKDWTDYCSSAKIVDGRGEEVFECHIRYLRKHKNNPTFWYGRPAGMNRMGSAKTQKMIFAYKEKEQIKKNKLNDWFNEQMKRIA